MRKRVRYVTQLHRRPVLWLAWVAAILYSSWPLGFVLNPAVGQHDLASQLEAMHEPYDWVFIGMDVLSALAITAAGLWQIRTRGERFWLKWSAISFIGFGFLVAVAALAPLNCNPEAHTCGPLLHNPLLIIHGAASLLSPAILCAGLLSLCIAVYQHRRSTWSQWVLGGMLLTWIIFGIWGLYIMRLHMVNNFMQYGFITVCSLTMVLLVATIEHFGLIEETLVPEADKT